MSETTEETKNCQSCSYKTPQEYLGKIPEYLFDDGAERNRFIKTWLCTHCGTLNSEDITEAEKEEAEETIIEKFVEHGFYSEEEAEELLD